MTALADSPTAQHGRGAYRGPGGAVPGPVSITASCLPVLDLAMGTALAHMLRGDATAGDTTDNQLAGPASERSPGGPPRTSPQTSRTRTTRQGPRAGPVPPREPASPRARPARQHHPVPPRI